jgi:hypothetical protein
MAHDERTEVQPAGAGAPPGNGATPAAEDRTVRQESPPPAVERTLLERTVADPGESAEPAPPALPAAPAAPLGAPPGAEINVPENTIYQRPAEAAEASARSTGSLRNPEGTQRESSEDRHRAKGVSKKCTYRVPGYQILDRLGEGTYGEVWRAKEHGSGIEVAIKFFNRGTTKEWVHLLEEVKQLALLHGDPGIIQLKEVNAEARPPFFIMAYAPGGCLSRRLKQGKLPVAEALPLFRQVCEALAYVHAKGIRHCDLKPGNILLDALNKARVADFGQAHLTSDLSPALGTFFYMAPEQADTVKQVPDTRWDVYAAGALFYVMVTGEPPRRGGTIDAELANTQELPHRLRRYRNFVMTAPRPTKHHGVSGIGRDLARLIDRCLAISPDERPRDAAAVLAELDRIERSKRRRPYLYMAVAAPVLLLLFLAGLGFWEAEWQIGQSGAMLEKQLGESDLTGARLVAYKVKEQIAIRSNFAHKCASDEKLRQAAAAHDDAATERLTEVYYREISGRKTDSHVVAVALFYADGHGAAFHMPNRLITAKQFSDTIYSHREFFNGVGDFDEGTTRPPINKPHVSQPFTGRATAGKLTLGISTPVFDPKDDTKVVGVLMVTLKLEDLNDWLKDVKMQDGFVTLFNGHKQVFEHRHMENVRPQETGKVPRPWDCPLYDKVLDGQDGHEVFTDPVDGHQYLAGYAPIDLGDQRWGVIVQHDYDKVTRPVADLRNQMVRWGLSMLAASVFLLGSVGASLVWLLRREEKTAHA